MENSTVMEENTVQTTERRTPKSFFIDMIKGFVMGVAVIIPGFSGGTIAVVLGIYNGFIDAIAGLFRHFKKNFFYLLPFVLGILIGVVALIVPIRLGFEYIPLPLICLFVGLMLGGMPPIIRDAGGRPGIGHIVALILACAFAVGICFIPAIGTGGMDDAPFPVYLALAGVGALAAAGCIVPGISGSMIAMIFGFYDDVIKAGTDLIAFNGFWHNALILLAFGIGIIIGFFTIAFIMRALLRKFPKGTYYAIMGFIVGSVFSIYYKQAQTMLINPELPIPLQVVLAITLFAIGFAATFTFCMFTMKKEREIKEKEKAVVQEVD